MCPTLYLQYPSSVDEDPKNIRLKRQSLEIFVLYIQERQGVQLFLYSKKEHGFSISLCAVYFEISSSLTESN